MSQKNKAETEYEDIMKAEVRSDSVQIIQRHVVYRSSNNNISRKPTSYLKVYDTYLKE